MIKQLFFLFVSIFTINNSIASAELIKDQVLHSDTRQRTYDLFLPEKNQKELRPLVLLLHGHGGDADVMTGQNRRAAPYKVWLSIAEREGWVLLIPDGEIGSDKRRGWNDCRENATTNPNTDDVKFLNKLTESVSKKYSIDKTRIYVHGTSNGGNMAFRLAQESGDRFRATASIVAAMPEKNKCRESNTPVSILLMNGTDDSILPYNGGAIGIRKSDNLKRGSVVSTSETIRYWLNTNAITAKPKVSLLADKNKRDGSRVQVEHYFGGRNNTEVVLYKVDGGGHTEPSLSEHYRRLFRIIVGNQNKDIEMAEEVWKFFERNR